MQVARQKEQSHHLQISGKLQQYSALEALSILVMHLQVLVERVCVSHHGSTQPPSASVLVSSTKALLGLLTSEFFHCCSQLFPGLKQEQLNGSVSDKHKSKTYQSSTFDKIIYNILIYSILTGIKKVQFKRAASLLIAALASSPLTE